MSSSSDMVIDYHRRTKHEPNRMARGPGRMDWANQPNPFRSYEGSERILLERIGFDSGSDMSQSRRYPPNSEPSLLNMKNLSCFLFESLAISGRKGIAGSEWSLRVNPSSGNLHPTECYIITEGPGELELGAGVYHYRPKDHSLELLAGIREGRRQPVDLPAGTILLVFTSIYWRESWKYGERAFRYCMIDLGHALAAAAEAARCLGWKATLIDDLGTGDLARIIWNLPEGVAQDSRSGRERPDVMLAISTEGGAGEIVGIQAFLANLEPKNLDLLPNTLSPNIIPWPAIDAVSEAVEKPPTMSVYSQFQEDEKASGAAAGRLTDGRSMDASSIAAKLEDLKENDPREYCHVLRRRRSAQAMDGKTSMPLDSFLSILRAVMPGRSSLSLLPWRPQVHPVLFVHRVDGIDRGLYILLRDESQKEDIRLAMDPDFLWERPSRIPQDLELYLLSGGDGRLAAKESSCRQDIASDGCFAAAMIAGFEESLDRYGPWFYSRLHWECGMIGQALYLASEANGYRGCGIGCFFDDMLHGMLGLTGMKYQDLYHFTVGRALTDPRLLDLPAYG